MSDLAWGRPALSYNFRVFTWLFYILTYKTNFFRETSEVKKVFKTLMKDKKIFP
jgi:hypothetical protein